MTTTGRNAVGWLVGAAALASAGAGLVHAAAAGSHAGDRTLAVLFALTAVAQVGWAARAALRPGRAPAAVGAALSAGLVAVWMVSRTVGLPLVDSLREAEPVGLADGVAAGLAAVAAVAAGLAALGVTWSNRTGVPGLLSPVAGALAGVAVVALAVPAMAADHAHGAEGHEHADGHEHAEGDSAAGGHEHTGSDEAAGGHEHGEGEGEDAAGAVGDHAHEVPERLDHAPTEEQLDDARELVAATEEGLAPYAEVTDAEAAGYVSIGDSMTGVEHFVNHEYLANDAVLDPDQPESLVYEVLPEGGRRLTTAMYIMPPASTMDDVPDVAGNLSVWHGHDNLCWDETGTRLAGLYVQGRCRPGGTLGVMTPMLHVWIVPNECGPFAGTDRGRMTGSCVGADALA